MGDTMANYDRRILVPYLQDVCCAEMLCRKLEQDIRYAKAEADKYAGWANASYPYPPEPLRNEHWKHDDIVGVCGFSAFALGALCIPVIGVIFSLIFMGCIVMGLFNVWKDAREADKKYDIAMSNYAQRCANIHRQRESIPEWRATARKWEEKVEIQKKRLMDAQKMRGDLYSVNIIPSRYRTIHAAYYLYDFFSSGRETDLERTIQTMLLDEIVQRMDRLIAQNQEIILNQRMLFAQQEQRNRDDNDRHLDKMRHIAQIEENQQRQTDYQNMIARNQQVTNFFLAADYLRKNR